MTERTLTIQLLSPEQAMQSSADRFINAWQEGEYAGEYLTFTSPGQLFKIINSRRWDIIVKLQQTGKVSIRELARQLERDVRRVHDDIKVLIEQGIIEQDNKGVAVPFSEIHADFTLKTEAA